MSREARELGGREAGKVGVVVAGGSSGARWEELVEGLEAGGGSGDGVCVVGVNGVISGVGGGGGRVLDYWLGLEIDDSRKCGWMPWNLPEAKDRARHLIINRQTPKILNRAGIDFSEYYTVARNQALSSQHGELDPRKMVIGLKVGPHGGVDAPLGGAALPALHFAGYLGVTEVHSIGVDMCFRSDTAHHWYKDGLYSNSRQDVSPKVPSPMVEYEGLKTNRWFVRTAEYLVRVRREWWQQGYRWYDHSDGLLQRTPGWDDVLD